MAGLLDRLFEDFLIIVGNTGAAAGKNFPSLGNEQPQSLSVFVVDSLDF